MASLLGMFKFESAPPEIPSDRSKNPASHQIGLTGGWTFLDDNSNSSVPGYILPPTFHNLADHILHNIVIKDIFANYKPGDYSNWLQQYSGGCLFNIEADNGEEEEVQKKILFAGGTPHSSL